MSDIALTSAMRRNLLSLQNTSKLMDMTSDRLSTGRKVNSALDNPSSFFTARGLTNRAGDLSSLLDAMGQGIQTLKAAEQGIETITDLVKQAKAVADEAYEAAAAADKGAVFTVSGSPATPTTHVQFAAAGVTDGTVLTAAATSSFTVTFTDGTTNTVYVSSSSTLAMIAADLNGISGMTATYSSATGIITMVGTDGETVDFSGTATGFGAGATTAMTALFASDVNGQFDSDELLYNGTQTPTDIVITTENGSKTFSPTSTTTVADLTDWINDNVEGLSATFNAVDGFEIKSSSGFTIEGLNGTSLDQSSVGSVDGHHAGRTLTFGLKLDDTVTAATSSITIDGTTVSLSSVADGAELSNALDAALGSDWQVGTDSEGYVTLSYVGSSTSAISYTATTGAEKFFMNDGSLGASQTLKGSFNVSGNVNNTELVNQFNDLLSQIDAAKDDSSYKGINLLNGSNLTVNFNEDRTSNKTIMGVTFDASGLGFATASGWKTTSDIQSALDQVDAANTTLRSQSAKFGREGAVIQTRQDFTEKMINTLQEGADNLTLADMNEEGANMLALQTRQQLATSSLSMASQASQAVLSLFR